MQEVGGSRPGAPGRERADRGVPSCWQACRPLPAPQRCQVLRCRAPAYPPSWHPGWVVGARPGGAGEGWAPRASSDRGEGNRTRPVALQVLKFSAEGNAPKTCRWKWLCGCTPVAGGSSGSRRQTPSPPRAPGDPPAAGVEVAVPV